MENIEDIIAETLKNLKPHERRGLEEIQNGIFYGQKKFTKWETKIMNKLENSKIDFKKKFRKFPLKIDNYSINYVPDFVIDFSFNKRRKILIEVQEELKESDIKKFQTFMDTYGTTYWFILVTKDEELEKWNMIDNGIQSLFHDIWTLDGIDDLVFTLERLQSKSNEMNEVTVCPKCRKKAEGRFEIEALFGYRYEGKKPQSYCRVCRTRTKTSFVFEHFGKPKEVLCPGCGVKFFEEIRGQSFCTKCLEKYYN